jgi:biopolymer transport protein ExbB
MATATTQAQSDEQTGKLANIFAAIVIPLAFIVAVVIYIFVLGNPANFIDDNPANHPKQGNWFGVVHKGGWIVPILLGCLIIVIVFSIERFITITRAKGNGNIATFVKKINYLLDSGNLAAARQECDRQKGSVANVVYAGLEKYEEMERNNEMVKEQKVLAIQKEVEEATALELPMLQRNLPIIATLAPIGTLIGLLGTVIGMIKAFAALATAGAPDATGLATGISEALINTALGIGTSAIAIVMYNIFTTRIDHLTYNIDEAGYTLTQTFASKH